MVDGVNCSVDILREKLDSADSSVVGIEVELVLDDSVDCFPAVSEESVDGVNCSAVVVKEKEAVDSVDSSKVVEEV